MSKELYQDTELVSMLADGALQGAELDRALAHLADSDAARQTWDRYQLVGEVMRSGHTHARAHDPAFVQKLRCKLAQDAIEFVAFSAIPISATGQKAINIKSANDAWWQRVAGVAVMALASVLAWQGYALVAGQAASAAPQLAQSAPGLAEPANVASSAAPSVMLRDPRLDALLAAHRQFGGTSALQMPSGFLRNATFDEGQR